jgi:hypothetical protein
LTVLILPVLVIVLIASFLLAFIWYSGEQQEQQHHGMTIPSGTTSSSIHSTNHTIPTVPANSVLLRPQVKEAVEIMIDLWIAEHRHENDAYPVGPLFDCVNCNKPYRYNELTRDGKGSATNSSSGLLWTAHRPSDDACVYHYLIPANMFAVVALGYVSELATLAWHDPILAQRAQNLAHEVDGAIQLHGIVPRPTKPNERIYAYEVDGLGNVNLMDDANVPSLISVCSAGDSNSGQAYIVGMTEGSLFVNGQAPAVEPRPGSYQAFIQKITLDTLNPAWTVQLGGVRPFYNETDLPPLHSQEQILQGVACAVTPDGASVYFAGNV